MRIPRAMVAWGFAATIAVPAGAQFTAVVAPPKPRVDSAQRAAQAATIAQRRDSATQVTMTGMREWVDSAAATLRVRVDSVTVDTSARAVSVEPRRVEPPPVTRPTEEFREGARAPDTATPLPVVALIGVTMLVCGLWLLRRRPCVESSDRS